MRSNLRILKFSLLVVSAAVLLWFAQSNQHAQTQTQFPTPTGLVNDFAGVLPADRKEKLQATLENLKLRSKVELYVVTVEETGSLDIFDYSRDMSRSWNVGFRTSNSKSLLLVVAVNSKTSFTQFTRLVQADLPEGVLGEMSQRMRPLLASGQFADAVDQAVLLFVNSLAQKIGLSLQDIDKPLTVAGNDQPGNIADSTAQMAPAGLTEQSKTRPRVVSERETPSPTPTSEPTVSPESATPTNPETTAPPTEQKTTEAVPTPTPAAVESGTPVTPTNTETSGAPASATSSPTTPTQTESDLSATPKKPDEADPSADPATTTPAGTTATKPKPRVNRNQPPASRPTRTPATRRVSSPANDADELEEVELTLTKPLAERAVLLRQFLDTHPDSKARSRAIELLISTRAALGDESLKAGDISGGVAQLTQLIEEADTSISEKLFSGVIAQIPLNLYLRGEHTAAFSAAQNIEAKFGTDPKRLLAIAGFYLGIERGDEVVRLAEMAIKLAPDLAEAHQMLARGSHISLRIDEAAAEYKRAFELDANAKGARVSLADLYRASGKPEEALTLYQEQLAADAKDKAARTGVVLSLFELGRKEEANTSLEQALADEPRNLPLLTGAAYWFVAHEDFEKALTYAQKAVVVEPRYTWAQIALARTLVGLKRPLDAERSMRYARQYGKFPTLNYELANVLANMGLYDEAAEVLRESFSIKDAQIETHLAGRFPATNSNFIDLLAPERTASIYQPTAADNAANAKMLKELLSLSTALAAGEGENPEAGRAEAAAREFAGIDDNMRVFRQIYGASRLLRNNVGLQTVLDLTEDARKNVDYAATATVATMATQADEYRDLRARAIAAGQIPDVAAASRSVVASILRGRLDDISGWALFNQEKYPEATENIKRAVSTLPEGTPAWRTALWHLGVVNEQTGNNEEALANYIKSYLAGERDPIRRPVIERLYRKVNGSLDGLDDKIGAAVSASATATTEAGPAPAPATETPTPAATTEKTPAAETSDATKPDAPKATEEAVKTPETNPQPSSTPPTESAGLSDAELSAATARARSTVRIRGHVLDENRSAIANVVVVLISPSGTVLAATTDSDGKFSFTVAPSEKAYRVIPSKDGYTFTPIDRALSALLNDQLEVDFVGARRP